MTKTLATSKSAKCSGSEINTGTDDIKFATAKAITDSNLAFVSEYAFKAQLIEQIFNILTTAAIKGFWIYDQHGASTSVTDRGTLAHALTLSGNGSTLSPGYIGTTPYLTLAAGSTQFWETPDHNDFTFGTGSADSAFSVISLANFASVTGAMLMGKDDQTTGATQREWVFYVAGGLLTFEALDDSAGALRGRRYNTTIASDIGSWHVYAGTYSGNAATTGFKVYRDGVQVDSVDRTSGTYTAMENKTAKVGSYKLDTSGTKSLIFDGSIGVNIIVSGEISAANILRVSNLLRMYAGVNV